MTNDERALLNDMIQMYEDNIETKRYLNQPIPSEWVDGLAKAKASLAGKSNRDKWVYSLPVFGHPEITALHGFQHLIPIRIERKKVRQVDRYLEKAIEKAGKLGEKWFVAESIVSGKRRPFGPFKTKKAAKTYLTSANGKEAMALHDIIREETIPELQRLRKAVAV